MVRALSPVPVVLSLLADPPLLQWVGPGIWGKGLNVGQVFVWYAVPGLYSRWAGPAGPCAAICKFNG